MPPWWGEWVGVLMALGPGLFAWGGARVLLRLEGAPGFEQALFDYRRCVGMTWFLAGGAALVATRLRFPVVIAVVFVASVLGMYPLHRKLHAETWGRLAHAAFQTRVALAFHGFWLVAATGPLFVASLPPDVGAWPIAYGVGTLILLWTYFSEPAFIALLGARPLRAPEVASRFAAILDRSTVRRVVVREVAPRGGSWLNAVALTGGVGSVFIGRSLVQALTTDETVAVLAHEVAHLEQVQPRRAHRVAAWVLGPGGAVACAAAARFRLSHGMLLGWAWLVAFAAIYAGLRAGRKRRETEADRRAAELCGDPVVVARALTRLHELAHLPRHFPGEDHRHLSHPSLADRVAALDADAAAGTGGDAPLPDHPNPFRSIHRAMRQAILWIAMIVSFVATWRALNLGPPP